MALPARQPVPKPSHVVCVSVSVTLLLAGAAGSIGLLFYSLKWKARYAEEVKKTTPRAKEGMEAYQRGLERLERADRYAWTLKDVEAVRDAAEAAEDEFLQAEESLGETGPVLIGIARSRSLRFDYDGAADHYARGLALTVDDRARFESGMVHLMHYLARCSALTDDEAAADARVSQLKLDAEADLTAHARRGLGGPRMYLAIAALALLRGDYAAMPPLLENAEDPTLPFGPILAGWAALKQGKPTESLQHMVGVLGALTYLPEAHAIRARAMIALEPPQNRNARGEWQEVLRLAPTCAEAKLALGRALKTLGEPGSAEALAEAVERDATLKPYVPN